MSQPHPIRLVAAFALAAGVMHAVAMIQHLTEPAVYAIFFAVVATAQLAWGTALYRRPDKRRSLGVAAAANLAIVVIWALSRTTGLPLMPEAGKAEATGMLDILATVNELAIVALVIAILRPTGRLGTRLSRLTAEQQSRFATMLITATLFGILLGSHAR